MTNERFWIVWRDGGLFPMKVYKTQQSAAQEAARFADKNPGAKYHVLVTTGYMQTVVPDAIWHDAMDEAVERYDEAVELYARAVERYADAVEGLARPARLHRSERCNVVC